jgi:hypothetical protein
MPYGFRFDLTKISKSFFRELARISQQKELHKRLGTSARHIAEKFHLTEITGLDVPDTIRKNTNPSALSAPLLKKTHGQQMRCCF